MSTKCTALSTSTGASLARICSFALGALLAHDLRDVRGIDARLMTRSTVRE